MHHMAASAPEAGLRIPISEASRRPTEVDAVTPQTATNVTKTQVVSQLSALEQAARKGRRAGHADGWPALGFCGTLLLRLAGAYSKPSLLVQRSVVGPASSVSPTDVRSGSGLPSVSLLLFSQQMADMQEW